MTYEEIVFERRNDAAWIGINRPEVRNAFREQTLDELAHALESTREDPSIVAAVVHGTGGHFSAFRSSPWWREHVSVGVTN